MALYIFCPLFSVIATFKTEVVILSAPCSYIYGRSIPQDILVAILFSQKQFCKGCLSSCHSPTESPLFNNPWHCSSAEINRLQPNDQSSPPYIFANEALLEYSPGPLVYILSLSASLYNSRAEQWQRRLHDPQSLKYLPSGPLQKEFANTFSSETFFHLTITESPSPQMKTFILTLLNVFLFLWINLSKLQHLL